MLCEQAKMGEYGVRTEYLPSEAVVEQESITSNKKKEKKGL